MYTILKERVFSRAKTNEEYKKAAARYFGEYACNG
jgi:hypothetical protein